MSVHLDVYVDNLLVRWNFKVLNRNCMAQYSLIYLADANIFY